MGGYKNHADSTYLVAWDDQLVIKAGVTNKQRWRTFCLRGARLVLLHFSDAGPADTSDLEQQVLAYLRGRLSYAFDANADAEPFLGHRGDGYLECYRARDRAEYLDALTACSSIMLAHPTGACSRTLRAHMHGRTRRTYGLTQNLQDARGKGNGV